jgi:hypothetical protein
MFSIAETFTFLAAAAANALPDGHLPGLALQLPFMKISESMGNHDSKIVDAGSVG